MTTHNAYAVAQPKSILETIQVDRGACGPTTVRVRVRYCGICGSDLHLNDGELGDASIFPQVSGHEVVGVVEEVGSEVSAFEVGDRVGIGWQRDACGRCDYCQAGEEQHCPKADLTCCYGNHGGFGELAEADERFVYTIPSKLDSAGAAPLLCAGHVVFAGLKRLDLINRNLCIFGLGGLGHLAVIFASYMGANITVVSRDTDKERDALDLGADRLVDYDELMSGAYIDTFHHALITSSHLPSFEVVTDVMRARGQVLLFGMSKPTEIPFTDLSFKSLSLVTVNGGSRQDMKDMFHFCQRFGIQSQVVVYGSDDIETALKDVRAGLVKYRGVLAFDEA
ncbi:alcohol dehydrogenase catalytic domain-containing protein [Halomonas caseinilytica]|uniref:alcohol dehydrogenase catalytic domain-containing protein n=1 Tax=Halomonas caseinilytica TaxID=438744 RepID=UPI0007E5A808|nr:alcohol dehydrogenase catalytic domain-containing protein [Halomonas caseinilytica]SEN40233.1 uncharacterized zinc-type alcohol dehydrogenase-like protein [Halomonas caseinilytica]